MTKPEQAGLQQKLYSLMDSFLVEAKDQHGNERSLERLNQDRHLFIQNALEAFESTCLEVIGSDDQTQEWSEQYHRFVIHREEEVDNRNDLRAQQHQALSKLLGRGEDASDE